MRGVAVLCLLLGVRSRRRSDRSLGPRVFSAAHLSASALIPSAGARALRGPDHHLPGQQRLLGVRVRAQDIRRLQRLCKPRHRQYVVLHVPQGVYHSRWPLSS